MTAETCFHYFLLVSQALEHCLAHSRLSTNRVKGCYSEYILKFTVLKSPRYVQSKVLLRWRLCLHCKLIPGQLWLEDYPEGSKQDYLTPFAFPENFVIRKAKKVKYHTAFTPFSMGSSDNFLQRKGKVSKCHFIHRCDVAQWNDVKTYQINLRTRGDLKIIY